nr:hypothetical protein [Mycobacterium kansasii]
MTGVDGRLGHRAGQAQCGSRRRHSRLPVADATRLDGFEGRFDTVVDSAFYHVFLGDEATQTRYTQALHRATRPGARLYMFEFSPHNVNGIQWAGIPAGQLRPGARCRRVAGGLPGRHHLPGALLSADFRRDDQSGLGEAGRDARAHATARAQLNVLQPAAAGPPGTHPGVGRGGHRLD